MTAEAKFHITGLGGEQHEIELSLDTYRQAEENGVSLAQFVNQSYPTAPEHGTAFAQMMASAGMYLTDDREYGYRPPSLKHILNGTAQLSGGAIVRPDGSQSRTPSGRLLFPAVLLETIESVLRDDKSSYIGRFNQMVAFTRSITSPKYEQVIINYANPQAARGQPIAQLDRPNRMLTITTSDVTRTIPTYAIGMEIAKQAEAAATLDLIGLAVREHALEERAAAMDRDITAFVNGDTDSGYSALSSVQMDSYDSAITTAGTLTQKAWVKFLWTNHRKRTITDIICDLDVYLAIEGRSGRPVKQDEPAVDERLNAVPRIAIPGVPQNVSIFVTDDSILGANTLVGLDRSKALRRVVYAGAEYNAVEEFVMRRSTVLRMDWAERIERAGYDDAFQKATLTV